MSLTVLPDGGLFIWLIEYEYVPDDNDDDKVKLTIPWLQVHVWLPVKPN